MKSNLIKSTTTERTIKDLQRMQQLPLEQKINLSLRRISDFLNIMDNRCYISFSGGKDSTVLLDLVRSINPNIEAVFVDTGLEFDSIRKFVKTFDNVTILKPKMRFDEVIKKYGYPVVSKDNARKISDLQKPSLDNERTRRIRLEGSNFKGGKSNTGKLSQKWITLKDAPFKISDKCCDIMKKNPAKHFAKQTGKAPFIGTMTEESFLRQQLWM